MRAFLISGSVLLAAASIALYAIVPAASLPTAMLAFVVLFLAHAVIGREVRYNNQTVAERLAALHHDALEPLGRLLWAVTKGQLAAVPPDAPEQWDAAGPYSRSFGAVVEAFNATSTATASLVDAAHSLTAVPIRRVSFTGIDDFAHGRRAAQLLGKLTGGSARVVVVAVDHTTNYSVLRERGFTTTLAADFPGITLAGVIYSGRKAEHAVAGLLETLHRDPTVDALYQLEEASTTAVFEALTREVPAHRLTVVGHGRRREFLPYFASGHVNATLTQSPYLQGFNPLIDLYNALLDGWRPDTPRRFIVPTVVHRDNYRDQLEHPIDRSTRAEPHDGRARRILKLVYLIPKDYDFWPPVKQGAEEAAELLAGRGVQVSVYLPDDPAKPYDVEQWERMIHRAADGGADGLVVPVFSDRLIPAINAAAERGVLVATYNQEPASLREMIAGVRRQADRVAETEQSLTESTDRSSQAIERVETAVTDLTADAQRQAEAGREITSAADQLQSSISSLEGELQEMMERATSIRTLAESGHETLTRGVRETDESVSAVGDTAHVVERLSGRSREVANLIKAINDIGDRTHMLAMNAGIESARAGEAGRGFAVVANEIRGLATQSKETSARIESQLGTIVAEIEAVHASVSTSRAYMERNRNAAVEMEQVFSRISEAVRTNGGTMVAVDQELHHVRDRIATVGTSAGRFEESLAALQRELADVVKANAEISRAVEAVRRAGAELRGASKAQEQLLRGFEV